MQTKAKCAMLTSLKTVLISSKNRASLIQRAVARKPKPASVMHPKMRPSSVEGSLNVASKDGAVAAEAQALQEDVLQAEAGQESGTRADEKRKVVARAQQKTKNQPRRRSIPRGSLGKRVIGSGQSLGHLSAAVGLKPSSVKRMNVTQRERGIVVEVEIGAGAGHDLDLGIGNHGGGEPVVCVKLLFWSLL